MLGFVNVYKPSGMTSSRVVTTIKKHFHIDKIGHMGTLDPIAEGILPLAIGKATRMFDYFLSKVKTYVVTYRLGYTTDTLDSDGEVVEMSDNIPSMDTIISATKKMIGKSSQMPPKYSAKKINGRKAYDLARDGIEFELNPKDIEITRFEYVESNDNDYTFRIECTSGTYIRAIGRDLGALIGCPMCMIRLIREVSGVFSVANSITLEDLLKSDDLEKKILKIEDVFPTFDKISINDDEYTYLINGRRLKEYNSVHNHTFVYYKDNIIGVSKLGNEMLFLDTHLRGIDD